MTATPTSPAASQQARRGRSASDPGADGPVPRRPDRRRRAATAARADLRRLRPMRRQPETALHSRSNVSAPLNAGEIAERLPTLQEKLDAEQLDSVQGKLSKYFEF